jgi:hypothetical protein
MSLQELKAPDGVAAKFSPQEWELFSRHTKVNSGIAAAASTSTWTWAAYHGYGQSDVAGAETKAIMRQDYVTYYNDDGSQRVRCLVTALDHGGGHFSNRTRKILHIAEDFDDVPDLIGSEEDTAEDFDDVPDLIGSEEDIAEDFDDMPDLIPIENNDGGGLCGELSRLYITAKPCPL